MEFNVFREACGRLKHREHAVEFWQDLDNTRSGFVSMFELDEEAVLLLTKFLGRLMSLAPNGDKLDGRVLFHLMARKALVKPLRENMLDMTEFKICTKPLGFNAAEIDKLFLCLDGGLKVQPPATVSTSDFEWLRNRFMKMIDIHSVIMCENESPHWMNQHLMQWADATKKEDLGRGETAAEPVAMRVHRHDSMMMVQDEEADMEEELSPGDARLALMANNLESLWRSRTLEGAMIADASGPVPETEGEYEESGPIDTMTSAPTPAGAAMSFRPSTTMTNAVTMGSLGPEATRMSMTSQEDELAPPITSSTSIKATGYPTGSTSAGRASLAQRGSLAGYEDFGTPFEQSESIAALLSRTSLKGSEDVPVAARTSEPRGSVGQVQRQPSQEVVSQISARQSLARASVGEVGRVPSQPVARMPTSTESTPAPRASLAGAASEAPRASLAQRASIAGAAASAAAPAHRASLTGAAAPRTSLTGASTSPRASLAASTSPAPAPRASLTAATAAAAPRASLAAATAAAPRASLTTAAPRASLTQAQNQAPAVTEEETVAPVVAAEPSVPATTEVAPETEATTVTTAEAPAPTEEAAPAEEKATPPAESTPTDPAPTAATTEAESKETPPAEAKAPSTDPYVAAAAPTPAAPAPAAEEEEAVEEPFDDDESF